MKTLVADFSAVVRSIEKEILALNPFFEYAGSVSSIEEIKEKVSQKNCEALIVDAALFGEAEVDSIFGELRQLGLKTILFVKNSSKNHFFIEASRIKVMEKPAFTSAGQDMLREYALLFEEMLEDKKNGREPISDGNLPSSANCFSSKKRRFDAVFIGVSTGGPATIQKLLAGLNPDFPVPILITQHIDSVFDKSLIDWLNSNISLPVQLACSGVVPEKGKVYFAPADFHLVVKSDGGNGFFMELNRDAPVNFVRPSVDKLFFSAAKVLKKRALAVLLTGMGNDGAKGCVEIKQAGGYTITEAENSCVIYGMPKAAFDAGGSVEVVELENMADRLLELVS